MVKNACFGTPNSQFSGYAAGFTVLFCGGGGRYTYMSLVALPWTPYYMGLGPKLPNLPIFKTMDRSLSACFIYLSHCYSIAWDRL